MSELGYVSGVYGYSGGLKLITQLDEPPPLKNGDWVFLMVERKPVPFKVVSFHGPGSIELSGIETVEQAKQLRGTIVMMPKSELSEQVNPAASSFDGWKLYDKDDFLGSVVYVEKSDMSVVLHVSLQDGREVLVPYHEDLVLEATSGILRMEVPSGLLDL